MRAIKNIIQRQQGFTYVEICFAFCLMAVITTVVAGTVMGAMSGAEKEVSESELRTFQQAVIMYAAEYEEVPDAKRLYETFLKEKNALPFEVLKAEDVVWEFNGYKFTNSNGDEFYSEADNKHVQPKRWLIVPKMSRDMSKGFIYAVDDRQPVRVIPGEDLPFNLDNLLFHN